jgi:16S rRNA (uracil1498-N3)-methyltransferase
VGDTPSFVYVPDLGAVGAGVALPDDEAHYVTRVCRARPGDGITATDGRGALARLRLLAVGREVRAAVESIERAERRRSAWVWCGAPEGERGDWMVEKLAELGAQAFQPVDCVRASWRGTGARVARWRRLAIAALRQSRRRFLMEVREPVPVAMAAAARPPAASCWLADPAGVKGLPPGSHPGLSICAVGPSGGFAPAEAGLLESSGFARIRLAGGRLRAETAAVSWCALWAAGEE